MSIPAVQGLRLMRSGDLPAVLQVQRAAYGDGYQESAEVLGAKLALAPAFCWVVEHGGAVGAYVFAHPWRRQAPPPLHSRLAHLPPAADCLFVHDVAVLPALRGAGAAGALFRQVAAEAALRRMSCLTLVALADAIAYWQRHGFSAQSTGLPEGYGTGAAFMSLPLPAAVSGCSQ
ncbi:GNAT family N-acetyltransferase [Azoarcus sp. TTM-91]|uniref:GNAT family N-acetyltransferase n=1 Tax=Azoarcus sp. TTM-91 TaxID=2691581 RepID=UPI002006E229|nr:GNAT family N-acetyltransferase [Azoarcus sp. TTM-91]